MAAPALCRAFTQNAWRRDLCSNCFRSKDEHKAAAAARLKTPSDAARLAATAVVKSILKGPSKAANGSGKKARAGVSFHKEESQVIGYGGDDEIHSDEEGHDFEKVEPQTEGDLEREKAEQQELERLTKANTDFNSVIANLQLESITQEKPTVVKSGASGIPVPGGRSPYTGPLRLGYGSKDGDGNKKTLLVSVRPFGSDGEEISKPVVKTKILVTNGYGNGVSSGKESKDSTKPLVNGVMTNGFGLSSSTVSKDTSLKVNVSPSVGNESKSTLTNGADQVLKGADVVRESGSSDSAKISENCVNGNCDEGGKKVGEDWEMANLSLKTGEDGTTLREDASQDIKSGNSAMANEGAAPVPANRSLSQQINSSSSVSLKNGYEKKSEGNSGEETKLVNGFGAESLFSYVVPKESGKSVPTIKESLNVKNKLQAPSIGSSLNTHLMAKPTQLECSKSTSDGNVIQHPPVPAERRISNSKSEISPDESTVSFDEPFVGSKENASSGAEEQRKGDSQTETTAGKPVEDLPRSSSGNAIAKEIQEVESISNERISISMSEAKKDPSNILPSSQTSLSQLLKKGPVNKIAAPKQESRQCIKKSDEEPPASNASLGTGGNKSVVITPQKPAPLSKRPAPSILKMGVPTGWHSKNPSQKNSSLAHPHGRDSNEDKGAVEKVNAVNGIIKTQPSTGAMIGHEKPSKPANTIAKLRANFVNNNLKIIAESAAKIVNSTRYGTKNVVADEIPMSKSSVMNLSMRPISTNSRTSNKSFHADDYELKDDRVKGLGNLDKVSNSFPSIRAKGSGPDIRELLRTPEKETEGFEFLAQGDNSNNFVEPGVVDADRVRSLDVETGEQSSREITWSGKMKDVQKVGARNELTTESSEKGGDIVLGSLVHGDTTKLKDLLDPRNELNSMQTCPPNKDDGNECRGGQCEGGKLECLKGGDGEVSSTSQASPESEEDGVNAESLTKIENGLEKTPPGEKNRKKGIVRRILFKGGNEIYRKAGEMVRSVRRSNESKDDAETTRETAEIKEKDLSLINKKPLDSKIQDYSLATGEVAASYEVTMPNSAAVEESINPVVKEIGGGLSETSKLCEENTPAETMPPDETVREELSPVQLLKADEVKTTSLAEEGPEKLTGAAKPAGTSQPPLMAPRPSFLHGRSPATQPWSLQSPSRNVATSSFAHNIPGPRSERAASVSALSPSNLPAPGGQRGRLSSLPALEPEGRSNVTPQGTQVALRKPGPIISGVKPAIPAKPSKILEASSARQGLNLTPIKPSGERKGSTTMSTPGSVGRSAGKRQAPKPPGMDMSEKRKCSSPEIVECQKEITSSLGVRSGFDIALTSSNAVNLPGERQMENGTETSHVVTTEEIVNESKDEYAVGLCVGMQEEEIGGHAQNQPSQLSSLSNNCDEELPDDSVLATRGTHFVKNQALNASKSSSRVARETERRQMLIQLQSSNNRGTAMQPDGSAEVPNSVLLATSNTALSARQRSASLGRGVGVVSPRPPLPGGSLGRAAGEGAALSIVSSSGTESTTDVNAEVGMHEDVISYSESPAPASSVHNPTTVGESANAACPVRSRSEGSLAVSLPTMPGDGAKSLTGAMIFDTQSRESMMGKGEEVIYDSPSGMSAKKKKNTVRGFLKFLRRGSVRDDANGNGYENREDVLVDSEPKTRPVIVHPMELDGACVEVVKGGGVDVRRRLEEESAQETTRSVENAVPSDQLQSSPRRPTNISIAPPRPPPVMHSPSSPSLSSSSSSSSGSTPVRPRPPPPPRGQAPVPPSPGGSGQKPARPPPPKPAHLMRLGLLDREVPEGATKNAGDGIYANLGEVRATLAPSKPQRTASMREVLGASGKNGGEAPTPRITPRVAVGASSPGSVSNSSSSQCIDTKAASSGHVANPASRVSPLDMTEKSTKEIESVEALKGDKLSWNVGVDVSSVVPLGASGPVIGRADGGTDSSSEEENSTAPPLPLVPPPSLPPPLPLHPPPSPPSHATSSSSSSSIGNALILPEDSGYESVEFHGVHDGEVNTGRWWAESSIAASRGSVVTTTADSLEESYEAVVGANHRALADVLAQVCQPNPEEFGANMTLRWSDFLVEGPKGGILRAVGPISFHRAALKGRASSSGRDSWRRVTLGIAASSMTDLPQYFRGCMCHDGGSAPISRCMPSLRPMCTFQDEIPNRFFSSETRSGSAEAADLIEATVMVFNPLHFYSLKTYLTELITERKSGQSFPPLPEESNWCNRACLFLLVLLDSLCSLDCSGGEDSLCVIREEAKPSPVVAVGDGQLGDSSHLACPLPRLLILPNNSSPKVISSVSPSTIQCFQSVVAQIVKATGGDSGMESLAHALNCILGLFQGGADDLAALVRSRAVLELWFFGPPIFHSGMLHSPGGDRPQEEIGIDAREIARWGVKNPILSVGEPEPLSVEGELLSATPRRWLDLERAGALRSLAVSALHRGSRVPSPLESGLEGSNTEEGMGVVGKCCRGWRVGEIGGRPTLPTCEEVRLRFLVGTSGSEVADAWESLARNELSSPTSVVNLGRTFVDAPLRKLTAWSISNGPEVGEAQC